MTADTRSTEPPGPAAAAEGPGPDETCDDLLGGALRLIQPRRGYRMAIDTVLVAAAVPAAPGDRVIEAGLGTGGAALALTHRTGAAVTGLEYQPALATLARRNAAFNGLAERITVVQGSVTDRGAILGPPLDRADADHVYANPPFSEAQSGTRSDRAGKGSAHHHTGTTLADWVAFARRVLRPRGYLTLIHRADRLAALLALLDPGFGDVVLCPLWPRGGLGARRILVQARKDSKGPAHLGPGLTLHSAERRYSEAAEAVLRHGWGLDLVSGQPYPPKQ